MVGVSGVHYKKGDGRREKRRGKKILLIPRYRSSTTGIVVPIDSICVIGTRVLADGRLKVSRT